jgi:hypothetical protein
VQCYECGMLNLLIPLHSKTYGNMHQRPNQMADLCQAKSQITFAA